MNDRDIPWLPAHQAPTLIPLLCYWCPSPDAIDEEDRPEFWGVAVRSNDHGADRWYQHCPLWEKGLGNPYFSEPDFFAPLGRPDGSPKWILGIGDQLPTLRYTTQLTPHKGGNLSENVREADTDPERIVASKAAMPMLGEKRSTVPLKVDGCGGAGDERR